MRAHWQHHDAKGKNKIRDTEKVVGGSSDVSFLTAHRCSYLRHRPDQRSKRRGEDDEAFQNVIVLCTPVNWPKADEKVGHKKNQADLETRATTTIATRLFIPTR